MSLNAYLRMTGERQGEIKGSVVKAGREDSIKVIAANHEIGSSKESNSRSIRGSFGGISGKAQHKPFFITKEVDQSSPLIYKMFLENENISDWKLQFWQPSTSGTEIQHYSVELINAKVTDISFEMLNNMYEENRNHKEREHISFYYQKIRWTWEDGGITAEGDWTVTSWNENLKSVI